MLYMVIERFKSAEAVPAVYRRLREEGRLMPDGLRYVDSWVEGNFDRCFSRRGVRRSPADRAVDPEVG